MLTTYPWLSFALGYAFAMVVGHYVVDLTVNKLWAIAEADFKKREIKISPTPIRATRAISLWHGITERAVYASCVMFGIPQGIAVWLAFKAVMRWKVSEDKDPRHVPGSLIYMIGTAMNIAFGVIGGFIALGRWSLWYST
jgi:hypothetical protein